MTVTIVKSGGWTPAHDGKFRVHVLDSCPHCKTKNPHAVEYDTGSAHCCVCCKLINLTAADRADATSPGGNHFSIAFVGPGDRGEVAPRDRSRWAN